MPSLGPLARAMKIHEIYITADGVVKSKNLPTDLYYDNVKITESRRYRRVETGMSASVQLSKYTMTVHFENRQKEKCRVNL